MNESKELLLLSDPQSFMAVVWENDPKKRIQNLHTLDDMMTCEALRHGIFNDREALPSLMQFYREIFLQAPIERRKEIYGHLAMIVPQLGGDTAAAFTPFMLLDPDMGIVSTATIDYASLGSLIASDPMTRVKDAVRMVESKIPANPAAVIGGLLALGDPRVCQLVLPLRAGLSTDDVSTVSKCFSGFTAKCVVEFYLDWLEDLVDRRDYESESIFGNVVAGLYRLADARAIPFIADGLRPFPVPQDKNAAWPEIRHIDPDEFAASIASKLYDLEQREGVPKVLPHAIEAFGLRPRSLTENVAHIQGMGKAEGQAEMASLNEVRIRAEEGDPYFQGHLAYVLFNGDGVPRDEKLARYWLEKAVEGEDPWALTTHAIELRTEGGFKNFIESTRLLEAAAQKGDARAHLNLGLHLLEGIGTEKDLNRGVSECLMGALTGFPDAVSFFQKLQKLPEVDWDLVFEHVRWPNLTFIMGPLAEGHLEGLTANRVQDNGTEEEAAWFKYERDVAVNLFRPASGEGTLIDTLFGAPTTIAEIYVGRAIISDEPLAAITINLGNIRMPGGKYVTRRPDEDALNSVSNLIATLEARKWVRWVYQTF